MSEQFKKLVKFIKNPSKFFEENKETADSLLDFMAFVIRISIILHALVGLVLKKTSGPWIIGLLLIFLFARIIANIFLFFSGKILNLFARIFGAEDNELAAGRVVAYSSSVNIISPIPIIGSLSVFLMIILEIIGVSKQYRISLFRSFMAVILPWIIIWILVFLFSEF